MASNTNTDIKQELDLLYRCRRSLLNLEMSADEWEEIASVVDVYERMSFRMQTTLMNFNKLKKLMRVYRPILTVLAEAGANGSRISDDSYRAMEDYKSPFVEKGADTMSKLVGGVSTLDESYFGLNSIEAMLTSMVSSYSGPLDAGVDHIAKSTRAWIVGCAPTTDYLAGLLQGINLSMSKVTFRGEISWEEVYLGLAMGIVNSLRQELLVIEKKGNL